MKNRLFLLFSLLCLISSCKKDCYLCKADCIRFVYIGNPSFNYCDNNFQDYDKYIQFVDSVTNDSNVIAHEFFTNNLSFCDDEEKLDKLIDRGMRCQKN